MSMHCDFCYSEDVAFVLPARTFEMGLGHGSLGDWACCSMCAGLIEKNQWTDLAARVRTLWERRNGKIMPLEAFAAMRRMHRELRKNISGSIRPI